MCKLWTPVVLLLSVVVGPCVVYGGFPQLGTPEIVRIDKSLLIKRGEVVVHWEFRRPRQVSLRRVEFVLILYAKGNSWRKFYPRFHTPPYQYTLRNLSPETKYIIVLQATAPNWKSSEVALKSFATLPSEWPTPRITGVSSRLRETLVEYSLNWVIDPLPGLLDHFEVRVCDQHCFAYQRNSTENYARVPVEFNSEVSIVIVANYDADDAGRVVRESEPFTGHSAKGGLGKIFDSKVEKIGNTIVLAWHPPLHPKGPRSYYEVFTCDPSNVTEALGRSSAPDWIFYKYGMHLVDDVSVKTLGHEHLVRPTELSANESAFLTTGQRAPPIPLLRVVYKRTPNCVRFRIFFEHPNVNRFFEIEKATSMKELVLEDAVATTFNFSADQRFHLSIHSCLTYPKEWHKLDTCGSFSTFFLISNVAAPSEVVEPLKHLLTSRMILTWKAPKQLNGPLDGFEIISERHEGDKVSRNSTKLEKKVRRTTFKVYKEGEKYVFKIAAFNLDRHNRSLRHFGAWANFTYPKEPNTLSAFGLAFTGFCLLIATVVVLLMMG